jgi:hypothetical protein
MIRSKNSSFNGNDMLYELDGLCDLPDGLVRAGKNML